MKITEIKDEEMSPLVVGKNAIVSLKNFEILTETSKQALRFADKIIEQEALIARLRQVLIDNAAKDMADGIETLREQRDEIERLTRENAQFQERFRNGKN